MSDDDPFAEEKSDKPRRRLRSEKREESIKIPVDSANEAIILAGLVNDEAFRKRHVRTLQVDLFVGPGHAGMLAALQELYRRGLEYDPATIRTLAGGGFDERVLDGYVKARPGLLTNAPHHLQQLRWDKSRAAAVPSVARLVAALQDQASPPEKLRALARATATAFEGAGDLRYLRDATALVAENHGELVARMEGRALYPTGIDALDRYCEGDTIERGGEVMDVSGKPRLIPGLAPRMVTVVSGRTGGGKSSVVGQIIARQVVDHALRGCRKVLWGAWENGPKISLEQLACFALGWSRSDVMTGDYDPDQLKVFEETMLEFEGRVRFFELPFGRARGEKGERLNDRHLDLIHQYIEDSGCEIVALDLFRRALKETRVDDEEQALYRIQAIFQETNTHGILVHQLRKAGWDEPTVEDLKGTGEWAGIADNVILVHLPNLYTTNDLIHITVGKQRHGRYPQLIESEWDGEFGSIKGGRTLPPRAPGMEGEADDFLNEVELPGGRRAPSRQKGRKR